MRIIKACFFVMHGVIIFFAPRLYQVNWHGLLKRRLSGFHARIIYEFSSSIYSRGVQGVAHRGLRVASPMIHCVIRSCGPFDFFASVLALTGRSDGLMRRKK